MIKFLVNKMGYILFLGLFLSGMTTITAQNQDVGELYSIAAEDGQAYIYHTENLGFLNGFHVERRILGGEWERITAFPEYPVSGGNEFAFIAAEYMPVLMEATNRETPQEVFLSLMTRQSVNLIASSVYPEVASALGKLYIDENPILNEQVEYRFIVVNTNQNPTGRILSGQFYLESGIPQTPSNVSANNRGREVRLSWEYPLGRFSEDGVSRFVILNNNEEQSSSLFEPGIYRVDGRDNYSYSFEVERLDREYNFSIVAADVAGQYSEPSEIFTIQVTDNIPPRRITGVQSSRFNEDTVEISWNVSIETKVAGYNLYRTVAGVDEFDLITEQPLEVLENVYRDTALSGGQHYRYYITAVDERGLESEPSNVSSIIIEEYVPPLPVVDLNLERTDNNQVIMEWSHTESEEFNTYVLLRKQIHPEEAESFARVNQERQTGNRFIDRGIGEEFPEGVTYRYGVAVAGRSGLQSDTTFQDIHIPLVTPPDPPSAVTVSRGEGHRINISWGASPSQTVTSYQVDKVLQEPYDLSDHNLDEKIDDAELTLIGTSDRGNRFLRENNIEPGFTYLYQVTAIDSAGNISSPLYSDPLYFRTQSAPQAVRNLQVRYIEEENYLRWEPSSTPRLTSYRIYRSEISTGTLELVDEVDPDVRDWQDPEGVPGLWYIVRAVDATGNISPRTRLTQAVQ